jgi:hypothetical protein
LLLQLLLHLLLLLRTLSPNHGLIFLHVVYEFPLLIFGVVVDDMDSLALVRGRDAGQAAATGRHSISARWLSRRGQELLDQIRCLSAWNTARRRRP